MDCSHWSYHIFIYIYSTFTYKIFILLKVISLRNLKNWTSFFNLTFGRPSFHFTIDILNFERNHISCPLPPKKIQKFPKKKKRRMARQSLISVILQTSRDIDVARCRFFTKNTVEVLSKLNLKKIAHGNFIQCRQLR